MTAKLNIRARRNRGIEGHRGYSESAIERQGRGFVGQGPQAPQIELTEWDWIESRKDWSRKEMAAYMLQWLNDTHLVRSEVDLPVFSQIVEACLLIQQFSREKGKIKNPEIALSLGIKINSLWNSVYIAIGRLDLKTAQALCFG